MEVLGGVLLASLVGSLHCIGMCGGFVALYSGSTSPRAEWGAHAAYNGARLVGYLCLGTAAGALGQAVDLSGELAGLQDLAALAAGLLILGWGGYALAQAAGASWTRPLSSAFGQRWLARILPAFARKAPWVRALALGLATALLPCGWLYGFAVTAAGTGHPAAGAAVMGVFWLGTVPALVLSGTLVRSMASVLGPRLGYLMPVLLMGLGLFTLLSRGLR